MAFTDDREHTESDQDVVYAPASERVPVNPVAGHRDFIEHPDTHTPEREAANGPSMDTGEPTFARVARPTTTPTPDPHTATNSTWRSSTYDDSTSSQGGRWL